MHFSRLHFIWSFCSWHDNTQMISIPWSVFGYKTIHREHDVERTVHSIWVQTFYSLQVYFVKSWQLRHSDSAARPSGHGNLSRKTNSMPTQTSSISCSQSYVVAASDCTVRIICSSWYPVVPPTNSLLHIMQVLQWPSGHQGAIAFCNIKLLIMIDCRATWSTLSS